MDEHTHQGKNVVPQPSAHGLLTRQEFQQLADVPAEVEWFANLDNQQYLNGNIVLIGRPIFFRCLNDCLGIRAASRLTPIQSRRW
jgi:hypothetical protein